MTRDLLIGVLKAILGESHSFCQQAKDLAIGFGFVDGLYCRFVHEQIKMAVSLVKIELFELCRRRQQDVRVVCRIGLEDFVDHREEVLAFEPGDNLA